MDPKSALGGLKPGSGGAIFSALSWFKLLPIIVSVLCKIPVCYRSFFCPTLVLFCCLMAAPTQWGLLTVSAQIGKKWISQQCNSFHLVFQEDGVGE